MKKKVEMCSCGSGRPADRCCRGKKTRMIRNVIVFTLIAATGSAIATMGFSAPEPDSLQVRTPDPWEYDAVNDRHWHAGHGHWHDGPAPAPSARGSSAGSVASSTNSFSVGNGTTTPASNAAPPGVTPQPWEYDEANNRHWHAGHGHYHPGPPPPPDQRN